MALWNNTYAGSPRPWPDVRRRARDGGRRLPLRSVGRPDDPTSPSGCSRPRRSPVPTAAKRPAFAPDGATSPRASPAATASTSSGKRTGLNTNAVERDAHPGRAASSTTSRCATSVVPQEAGRQCHSGLLYWPARSMNNSLGNKEFDEEDFFVSGPTRLEFQVAVDQRPSQPDARQRPRSRSSTASAT